jgi:hypothetical protein
LHLFLGLNSVQSLENALKRFREIGEIRGAGHTAYWLAVVSTRHSNFDEAEKLLAEALRWAPHTNNKQLEADCLAG